MKDRETRNRFLKKCHQEENLIVLPCGTHSVRFRPFLNVTEDELKDGAQRMGRVLVTI